MGLYGTRRGAGDDVKVVDGAVPRRHGLGTSAAGQRGVGRRLGAARRPTGVTRRRRRRRRRRRQRRRRTRRRTDPVARHPGKEGAAPPGGLFDVFRRKRRRRRRRRHLSQLAHGARRRQRRRRRRLFRPAQRVEPAAGRRRQGHGRVVHRSPFITAAPIQQSQKHEATDRSAIRRQRRRRRVRPRRPSDGD